MPDRESAPLQVAIFAGENSGDVQAAHLLQAIRRRGTEIEAWGVGGPSLAEAGARIEFDSRRWGAIGIAEAIRVGFGIVGPLHWSIEMLGQRLPPLVIVVDFGAFNKHIARASHKLGLNVFWYFPPGSWSRRARVGRELAQCTSGVATPFPWSEVLLQSAGVNGRFLGHPLLDIARPKLSRKEFRSLHGLRDDRPLVAYFPASRAAELRHIWPAMAGAGRIIANRVPGVQHALGLASSIAHRSEVVDRGDLPGLVITSHVYDLLNACDCVITKSGTITLEATIFEKPMAIVYKVSRLAWMEAVLIHKRRVQWAGMPNILAEETICPELLGDECRPETIAETVIPWLLEPSTAEPIRQALRRVKCLLGEPGGVDRAAEMALGLVASTR